MALEAKAISVQRGGRLILDRVDLRVEAGSLDAIAGPNGSGKSTLLRALAGIWPVAEGAVTLDEQPLARFSRREISRRVGFVPQDARVDFAFTVEETVAMGRHPHRGRFQRETPSDVQAIQHAVTRCDVTHLLDRTVNTLSGGERQRVLIARSLAVEPEFILLDEPTANLDVAHTIEILELARALAASGQAVVLATHDLNAVARYATSVALIDQGRIVERGDRNKVLDPQTIERVFGVHAETIATRTGQPVFVFHSKTGNSRTEI